MTDINNVYLPKYIVRTCVCNTIEIDRRDIVYWDEKASLDRKEIPELVSILNTIRVYLATNTSIEEAKMYEFSQGLFYRPNVMFYKDNTLSIWDGKSGRIVIDSLAELDNLINLLSSVVSED